MALDWDICLIGIVLINHSFKKILYSICFFVLDRLAIYLFASFCLFLRVKG